MSKYSSAGIGAYRDETEELINLGLLWTVRETTVRWRNQAMTKKSNSALVVFIVKALCFD